MLYFVTSKLGVGVGVAPQIRACDSYASFSQTIKKLAIMPVLTSEALLCENKEFQF